MEKKTTEAQAKASRKWEKNNREQARYRSSRSSAKSFIRTKAKQEDLDELKILIKEREDVLSNETLS